MLLFHVFVVQLVYRIVFDGTALFACGLLEAILRIHACFVFVDMAEMIACRVSRVLVEPMLLPPLLIHDDSWGSVSMSTLV